MDPILIAAVVVIVVGLMIIGAVRSAPSANERINRTLLDTRMREYDRTNQENADDPTTR